MGITHSELWAKVDRLARELADVQQELEQLRAVKPLTAEQWWAARRERVRAENRRLLPLMDKAFKEMGAVGEPVGAEKVQAMIAACDVKPEENLFSRAIIKMREE